ncbi:MAG: hypothetical protein KDA84_17085, partial [Planctomycetaceae bacterium]|nr:hypothetical protein [Planctomycetaceae bacterium]
IQEVSLRTTDPLNVGLRITQLIEKVSGSNSNKLDLEAVPHVDFDAVLFAAEDAHMEIVRDK